MLLLHIAVILPFASCQLLFLHTSPSSETDAPIDKMECMERCAMPFLNIASTSGTPSMAQLCDGFVEMKECVLGCPGGAEMMKMVAGMVPQSFKLITEMCEGEGTTGTLSPDVLSGVLNEAAGMEQLDDCVTGCERNLQALMIGGMDALPELASMCQTWGTYQQCVTGCPEGAEVLSSVQKMMPSIFKTIEDTCDPVSSTGPSGLPIFPLLLNADETTNTDVTELVTDNTKYYEAAESTDSTQATDTSGATQETDSAAVDIANGRIAHYTDSSDGYTEATSDSTVTIDALESMFNCKGKCLMDLDRLRVSSGIEELCAAWTSMNACFGECADDSTEIVSMLRDLHRIMPKTVDYLTTNCIAGNDPSTNMDYQTMQQLLAEEKATDEMELCVQDCEPPIESFFGSDLATICLGYDAYKNCAKQCPGGDAAFDMVKRMMPEMVDFVEMICSPYPQSLTGSSEITEDLTQTSTQNSKSETEISGERFLPSDLLKAVENDASTDLSSNVIEASKSMEETDSVQGRTVSNPSEEDMMVDLEKIFQDPKLPIPENQVFVVEMEDPANGAPGVHLGWASLIGCLALALFSLQ